MAGHGPMAENDLERRLRGSATIEELALRFARDAYPELSVEAELRRLDELALPLAASHLDRERDTRAQALAISEHLHDTLELRGDESDYHDPRNSYLNEVLRRRVGLPITLGVVWIAIGRRLGVHVEGVGFPGHFLVRVGRERATLVDPFRDGAPITQIGLERLAAHHLGGADRLRAEHLATTDARAMLVRMLVNLKHAHERRADHARALVVCDRLVDLTGAPTFRRDRGMHALSMGAAGAALADLDAYLAAGAPEGDGDSVRRTREGLAARTRRVLQ